MTCHRGYERDPRQPRKDSSNIWPLPLAAVSCVSPCVPLISQSRFVPSELPPRWWIEIAVPIGQRGSQLGYFAETIAKRVDGVAKEYGEHASPVADVGRVRIGLFNDRPQLPPDPTPTSRGGGQPLMSCSRSVSMYSRTLTILESRMTNRK